MGLQLRDDVGGGVSAGAPGVDQRAGVLVDTLDAVRVVIGPRGPPGARDGGGALRVAVEVVDSLRLCSDTAEDRVPFSKALNAKRQL